MRGQSSKNMAKAKIVQYADERKTLPDGGKLIYGENENKIVVSWTPPFEKTQVFVYDRKTGEILINGKKGTNQDKRTMIKLGTYFLENSKEEDLITINVHTKDLPA